MKKLLLKEIKRPLSNAHWSLLVVIIFLYEFFTFGLQCLKISSGIIYGVIVATVFIVLWARHIALNPINTKLLLMKYLTTSLLDIILLIIIYIIVAIPLAIVAPLYECYTPRAKLAELIMLSSGVRQEIEQNIIIHNTLQGVGTNLAIGQDENLLYGTVTTEGIVILVSKEPVGIVILTPTLQNKQVNWKCSGHPPKIMPASCRE